MDEGLNYNLELLIDPETLEQELSAAFKQVVATAAHIGQVHDAVISKTGKILGQERTQLIEDLDQLFIRLAVVYAHFTRVASDKALVDLPLRVPIEMRTTKFVASGNLSEQDVNQVTSFTKDFNTRIVSRIKDMLVAYKQAVSDETVDDEEYRRLFRSLDGILYGILILRYTIKSLLIDR
jgi:hypothetical protein